MNTDIKQKAIFKDEATQKALNTPLADPTGVDDKDKELLELIVSLIGSGKIDLYKPETLINFDVYDKLDEGIKGQIDFEAMNLLSAVREISDLYENGFADSYQIQNSVKRVRETKERIESSSGDLFII